MIPFDIHMTHRLACSALMEVLVPVRHLSCCNENIDCHQRSLSVDSALKGSRTLQALPENVRESYADPASSYSFGWSHGKVCQCSIFAPTHMLIQACMHCRRHQCNSIWHVSIALLPSKMWQQTPACMFKRGLKVVRPLYRKPWRMGSLTP